MNHVVERPSLPNLPDSRQQGTATSLLLHAGICSVAVLLAARGQGSQTSPPPVVSTPPIVSHLIFVAPAFTEPSRGGGGGGNRQPVPVRRAAAVGTDHLTLRVAKPISPIGQRDASRSLPELVLDAKPLLSGVVNQLGLPEGDLTMGTSLGPGSGGGVGEGVGTGIGPGRGPGFGEGSGGGIGGGIYRPGGSVSAPRVITEVRPTYTDRAMVDHIQGSVVLEMIVRSNGVPSNIRVVRSLDVGGLDEQAVRAASQWRFAPGRLNGEPVDVLVVLQVDFHIR